MTEQRINAFPYRGEFYKSPGMELRDWFAGQALAGFHIPILDHESVYTRYATAAYVLADAMMAQRTHINDEEGN